MAKHEQRKAARVMFVEQGRTRRDIANALGVREKTVGEWAKEGNWEALRTEHVGRKDNVISTLKELIQLKTDQCIKLERDPKSDPSEKAKAYDALSKASKALAEARGEDDMTLSVRIRVMQWVFDELEEAHPELYRQLVDFQERMLEKASSLHA